MRYYLAILLSTLIFSDCICQRSGRAWAFGDSIGIDFNDINNPAIITSACKNGYETFASIADSNGNLLLYFNNDRILNGSHLLIENGDSLKLHTSATQGNLVLPVPENPSKYYLFYISLSLTSRIRHAVVDMSLNNGLGKVIIKNKKLWSQDITEKLQAVKHANGRDWWIVVHEILSRNFVIFKLTQDGITDTLVQSIGPVIPYGEIVGQMKLSRQGDKLVWADAYGRLAVSKFDRCTGAFYAWQQLLYSFPDGFYGCELSYSGNVCYVNESRQHNTIYQFDLTATDIVGSATIVYVDSVGHAAIEQFQIGPDKKIYIANRTVNVPKDSFNTHLTVIAQPESLGMACLVQPYSFSLNNRESYNGLPNMPNYNLGPLRDKAPPGITCTWTGGYSDDWFLGCNWDVGLLPDTGNNVVVPGGTAFNPVIRGDTAYCKRVRIDYGNGGHLTYEVASGGYLVKRP